MKIGIYDSGIGGLSVLHRALKKMPEAEFIYYADTKHVPYGEKTREQIKGYVEEVLNFLIAKEVDAIVIACNTATSVATKEFRGEFAVPIVGMEPAVKRALKLYQDMQKRILVTATPVTIAGEKLHSLLEKYNRRGYASGRRRTGQRFGCGRSDSCNVLYGYLFISHRSGGAVYIL